MLHDKRNIAMSGFITASLCEKLSKEYVKTSLQRPGVSKVMFKIRLKKCLNLEVLSEFPEEQEIVLNDPKFIVKDYKRDKEGDCYIYIFELS